MSTIHNPRDGVLLVRCASDEALLQAGRRNGLVTNLPIDGTAEWSDGVLVLSGRPGLRGTGRYRDAGEEGWEEIMETSPHLYAMIVGADPQDLRYQDFDIVHQAEGWDVPGWGEA